MLPTLAADATCVPFMNQIAISPLVSRHRISLLPLPSKSPVPTTAHPLGTAPTPADDMMLAPFISHTATFPLRSFHRMSPLPSPLKSPMPLTPCAIQPVIWPRLTADDTVVPFMNHIAVL